MEQQDHDYGKKGTCLMYGILGIVFFLSIIVFIYTRNGILTF